mgnify:CR=1 FL=1
MKRRAIWTVALCGALSAAEAGTFHLPQKYQEMDQWCWAGCSQAILEYYGPVVTQTNIAIYGTGGVNTWNYLWGTGTSGSITRRGIREILQNFGGFFGNGTAGSVSETVVSNEMAALRPIVINWYWTTGGGHFVVSRGYVGGSMYLMDPWDGPTVGTYAWVNSGDSHTWEYTLRLTNAPIYSNDLETAEAEVAPAGAGVVLRWNCVSNKYYAVDYTTNLVAPSWVTAASNIAATWPQNAATVDVGVAESFYRIRWEP